MRGIYLASYKAKHENYNIDYQDINGLRDIGGDMLDVDLSPYDFIIATPPCNYWSRANYRRDKSVYAQKTKHLLPEILKKLTRQDKPFIVENVRHFKMFLNAGLFDLPCYVYFIGRHTYWTNVLLPIDGISQRADHVTQGNYIGSSKNRADDAETTREGGWNVKQVIDRWLEVVKEMELWK